MTETPPEDDRESTIEQGEEATELQTAVSSDYKVRGQKAAQDGTGVLGYNTATTGRSYGVEGVTDSADTDAAGVYGEATPSNGETYGLYGITNSDGGLFGRPAGVRGSAPAGSGSNANGVFGTTAGTGFTDATLGPFRAGGVVGRAVATSGVVANAGVIGTNFSTSGIGNGVIGETHSVGAGTAGVVGRATQGSGTVHGVRGEVSSPDGFGLSSPDDVKFEGALYRDIGAKVWLDTFQSIPSLSETRIEYDTVIVDDRDEFDTSNHKFVCATPGAYHVDAHARWNDQLSGDSTGDHFVSMFVEVNGSPEAYTQDFIAVDSRPSHEVSTTLRGLSAGDEITVTIFQSTTQSRELINHQFRTNLNIDYLGT